MSHGGARYLALGDSYTIGEGVPRSRSWPARLKALATEHGVSIADPLVIARTGWTTDELSAAIDEADPHGPFELVTLLVGVNDQYRGRTPGSYRTAFHELLVRAIGFAGGRADHVIVGSIPDWGVTPFADGRDRRAIAVAVDAFNDLNRYAASELGARYVDVTAASRLRGADPEMLAADGLHPSAAMYDIWARLALPAVLAALKAP